MDLARRRARYCLLVYHETALVDCDTPAGVGPGPGPRSSRLLLFKSAVTAQIASDVVSELSEGLHVVSCGSGTPLPDLTMAGVCTAVIAGGKLLVFDVGEGAPKTLASVVNHEFAYFQKASNAIL